MKPLSEQLSDLLLTAPSRPRTLSPSAQAKNRAALQSQRERLKSSIDAATTKTQADTTAAHEDCSHGGTTLARTSMTDSRR